MRRSGTARRLRCRRTYRQMAAPSRPGAARRTAPASTWPATRRRCSEAEPVRYRSPFCSPYSLQCDCSYMNCWRDDEQSTARMAPKDRPPYYTGWRAISCRERRRRGDAGSRPLNIMYEFANLMDLRVEDTAVNPPLRRRLRLALTNCVAEPRLAAYGRATRTGIRF